MTAKDKAIIKRCNATKHLLAAFDATTTGYDPGVSFIINKDWNHSCHFNGIEWSWLEPLLKELRDYRKGKK